MIKLPPFKNKLIDLDQEQLIALGEIMTTPATGRKHDKQITVADLTGIAIQDIQIVKAIID